MGRKEQEKSDFGELAFYSLMCVLSYVVSYLLLIAVLRIVATFVVVDPYPRLFCYLVFFVIAWHIANFIMNQIDR